jgi:hypothetical protein
MNIARNIATATARDAGRNVVHHVYVNGEIVATRRSAHRYRFAICKWITAHDGSRTVVVKRWSRDSKCSRSAREFAVYAESID